MMKPQPFNLPDRESRYLSASVEFRAAAEDGKPVVVRGYAAKFNVESENLGNDRYQFREIIAPGAFDDVLKDDVRALFNHDANMILARSKNGEGSLKLGTDEIGLWYEFEAPDTQVGRDLVESLKRGDVDQSSFSFTIGQEAWEERQSEDGPTITKRTVQKVKRLYDVSPVTYPAYPDATVALRSLEQFKQENQTEPQGPTEEQISEVRDWAAYLGLH